MEYLRSIIERKGHAVLVLDVGCLGEPYFTPDITAEQVAQAAGGNIENVRALIGPEQGAEVMTAGALRIVKGLTHTLLFGPDLHFNTHMISSLLVFLSLATGKPHRACGYSVAPLTENTTFSLTGKRAFATKYERTFAKCLSGDK